MAGSGWFVGGRRFWDASAAAPRRRIHMERLAVARGRAGIWHCTAYYPRMHEIPWRLYAGHTLLFAAIARSRSLSFLHVSEACDTGSLSFSPLERQRDDHPRLLVIVGEATRVQTRKSLLRDLCEVLDSWTCSL